jgi:hypothetical protein
MTFGEFVFSARLFQKIEKEDQNIKKKPNLTVTKTTPEDSRGHQKTPRRWTPRGCQVGPAGPTMVSPDLWWWPLSVNF